MTPASRVLREKLGASLAQHLVQNGALWSLHSVFSWGPAVDSPLLPPFQALFISSGALRLSSLTLSLVVHTSFCSPLADICKHGL